MDESIKKIKQLKAREETTMRTTLPCKFFQQIFVLRKNLGRLRVFEKFPTRPQMVTLRKVSSEFPMPKVRDSFTRQFSELNTTDAFNLDDKNGN
jgi:hypothetical protein